MVSPITPEYIAKYKQYLKEHPIDHKYDELAEQLDCGWDVPWEQIQARLAYWRLKDVGEVDENGNVKE